MIKFKTPEDINLDDINYNGEYNLGMYEGDLLDYLQSRTARLVELVNRKILMQFYDFSTNTWIDNLTYSSLEEAKYELRTLRAQWENYLIFKNDHQIVKILK